MHITAEEQIMLSSFQLDFACIFRLITSNRVITFMKVRTQIFV